MRLTPGGIRELHWHKEAEWAYVIAGSCRISILDEEGRPFIDDVSVGDLWYFPPGCHCRLWLFAATSIGVSPVVGDVIALLAAAVLWGFVRDASACTAMRGHELIALDYSSSARFRRLRDGYGYA
jgi:Cupin